MVPVTYTLPSVRLLLLVVLATTCRADEQPPFVSGFDRFARHGEIDTVTAGRLLLGELSCTACHAADDQSLSPKRGPVLRGAGSRLQQDWLSAFLASPSAVKPGTTMPEILSSLPADEKEETVQALVAFLGSLVEPFPEIKGSGARPVPNEFWNHGDAAAGRLLFHRIGCVACHPFDESYETTETQPSPLDELLEQLDPEELEEAGLLSAARQVASVPLGRPSAKYTRQSLTHFLLDPHRVRPGGRMPDLQLGVVEAADIATWLLHGPGEDGERHDGVAAADAADAEADLAARGRRLFDKLGCASCHDVDGEKTSPAARPLSQLNPDSARQCTGEMSPGIPHFALDEQQQQAVQAALQSVAQTPEPPSIAEQIELTMLSLNCLGCHERDGLGGVGRYRKAYFETVGHVDIGDEGRLPPSLTGVGRKLKEKWLTQVLQGKGSVRSHMRIRMPLFAARPVKSLPGLLAKADRQAEPRSEQYVFGDTAGLTEAGRQLLDVGCVQCHPLRGEALPGVLGTDLEGVTSRLHPDWFHDFVLNPGELKTHTRMPSFFPRGKSQNQKVLGGDTERQIAAMWSYLKGLSRNRLPDKIEQARSQSYELKPDDRPVLLRTFMKQVGTHAIAVGFPQQTHFAFDAEQLRLAQVWRGRFLDAQGTWFVRFAPPASPLGDEPVNLSPGPTLAFLTADDQPWPSGVVRDPVTGTASHRFRGFRLDDEGVPVFLYRIGDVRVEDRISPDGQQQLVRRLTVMRPDSATSDGRLWLRLLSGRQLEQVSSNVCRGDSGLVVRVDQPPDSSVRLRKTGDAMDWMIPLSDEKSQAVEVHYQW